MALNPADISVRSQNIGVLEGGRARTLQEQLADQEAELRRQQMAQQNAQFNTGLDWAKEQAAEAAARADKDRWFQLGGSLLGNAGSAFGSYLGRQQATPPPPTTPQPGSNTR